MIPTETLSPQRFGQLAEAVGRVALHNSLECRNDWIVPLLVRLVPIDGSTDTNSPAGEALDDGRVTLQQVEITPLAACFLLQMLHQALNRLGLAGEDAVDLDEEACHAGIGAPSQRLRHQLCATVLADKGSRLLLKQ